MELGVAERRTADGPIGIGDGDGAVGVVSVPYAWSFLVHGSRVLFVVLVSVSRVEAVDTVLSYKYMYRIFHDRRQA